MDGYTKLFGSIVASSIWGEDHATRIVWVTMLALADENGYVGASVSGLARQAVVTKQEAEVALAKFLAPDSDSRSDDFDGRRIEAAERGWVLLNHNKFRDMRNSEERRKQNAEAQQAARDKRRRITDSQQESARVISRHQSSSVVISRHQESPESAQEEEEASAEEEAEGESETRALVPTEPEPEVRPVGFREPLANPPANVQTERVETFIDRAGRFWAKRLAEKHMEWKGTQPPFGYEPFDEHSRWRVFEERCERAGAASGIDPEVIGAQVIAEYFARTKTTYESAEFRYVLEDFTGLARKSSVLSELVAEAKVAAK